MNFKSKTSKNSKSRSRSTFYNTLII